MAVSNKWIKDLACEVCMCNEQCNGLSCINEAHVERMERMFNANENGEPQNTGGSQKTEAYKYTVMSSAPMLFVHLGEYFRVLGYDVAPNFAEQMIKITASEDWVPELIAPALIAMVAKTPQQREEIFKAGEYFFNNILDVIEEQQKAMEHTASPVIFSTDTPQQAAPVDTASGEYEGALTVRQVAQKEMNSLLDKIDNKYGDFKTPKKLKAAYNNRIPFDESIKNAIETYLGEIKVPSESINSYIGVLEKEDAQVKSIFGKTIKRSSLLPIDAINTLKTLYNIRSYYDNEEPLRASAGSQGKSNNDMKKKVLQYIEAEEEFIKRAQTYAYASESSSRQLPKDILITIDSLLSKGAVLERVSLSEVTPVAVEEDRKAIDDELQKLFMQINAEYPSETLPPQVKGEMRRNTRGYSEISSNIQGLLSKAGKTALELNSERKKVTNLCGKKYEMSRSRAMEIDVSPYEKIVDEVIGYYNGLSNKEKVSYVPAFRWFTSEKQQLTAIHEYKKGLHTGLKKKLKDKYDSLLAQKEILEKGPFSETLEDTSQFLNRLDEEYSKINVTAKMRKQLETNSNRLEPMTEKISQVLTSPQIVEQITDIKQGHTALQKAFCDKKSVKRTEVLDDTLVHSIQKHEKALDELNQKIKEASKEDKKALTRVREWIQREKSAIEKYKALRESAISTISEEDKKQYSSLFKSNLTPQSSAKPSSLGQKLPPQPSFVQEVKTIIKSSSTHHRTEFIGGKNAVQCDSEGAILDTSFKALNAKQKSAIKKHIYTHAKAFRTRFARNMKSHQKATLDIAETYKKACATGGIPINLEYLKPKSRMNNVVMILDVSGSCKNASEIMLTFMHYMRKVFPAGYKAYAFTNTLYDITDDIKTTDPDEAIANIMEKIPRAGAYSNYEKPLREYYDRHIGEINKESVVFFIGDARNNKNNSGERYFKAISRKSRKCFWLNTENKSLWNEGDSIIGTYAPYCDSVTQITTTAELLNALTTMQ